MEPFVPEPDERIGHQSGSHARNRSDGGGDSPTPPPRPPQSKSNNLPLLGVSAVFLVLLIAVYFIQQGQIGELREQLETQSVASGGNKTATPDPNAPTLDNQVAALSRLVDSQVIEIDRLKKQLASGVSSTASATEEPAPQVDNTALESLKAEIDALKEVAKTDSPAVVAPSALPTDWQAQIEDALGDAVKMQNDVIETQLLKIASIESRVDSEIADFEQNLAGQAESLTAMISQKVEPVAQKLSAMESQLSNTSEIEGLQDQIADYDQRLSQLTTQLSGIDSGSGSMDAAQLNAALDPVLAEIRPIKSELARLEGDIEQSQAALAPVKSELERLQQSVGQAQTSIPRLEQRVDTLEGDLASTRNSLEPVRAELNTLDGNIDKALAQLDEQRLSMQQFQRSLEGVTAGSSNSTASSGEVAALKSQLDTQLNELKALRAKDDALAKDLRSSRAQLQRLQGDVASLENTGGGVSVVSGPANDTSALKAEIANLNVKTDTILSRVKDSESNMKFWQSRIEKEIAANPISAGGASLSPAMEETIRMLKKQHPYADFPDMD